MSLSRIELYGESIFTSFRTYDGAAPNFQSHIQRVFEGVNEYFGAGTYKFEYFNSYFFSSTNFEQKIIEFPNHYHRLTFYSNESAGALSRITSLSDLEFKHTISELKPKAKPLKLTTMKSPFTASLSKIKAGNYFHHLLLKKKALRVGFHDALMVREKLVTEATTSNIVFIKDKKYYTPKKKDVFPGITLKILTKIICIEEADIPSYKLKEYEEAFLVNSVTGITPICRIDEYVYKIEQTKKLEIKFLDFLKRSK